MVDENKSDAAFWHGVVFVLGILVIIQLVFGVFSSPEKDYAACQLKYDTFDKVTLCMEVEGWHQVNVGKGHDWKFVWKKRRFWDKWSQSISSPQ